jgi:hypothetical protein
MATSRHQSHRTSNTLVVNVVLNRSCDAIQPFGRETDGFGFNEQLWALKNSGPPSGLPKTWPSIIRQAGVLPKATSEAGPAIW